MNDWRSTFDGANDHEADWEQCFIVLEELPRRRDAARPGSAPRPTTRRATTSAGAGTTRASRRSDGHPIVYPGAGSHATYLERGEYIMRLPFPGEQNLRGPLDLLRRVWRDTLDQPDPGDLAGKVARALSVPFVDYARGDGVDGRARAATTSGRRSSSATTDPWVDGYRGLWGLDTGDRFAGERAPAGPKYTRTGTVRQSWSDPLGFSGLAKVPPPSRAPAVLAAGSSSCERERDDVRTRGGGDRRAAAGSQRGGRRAARRRGPRALRRGAPGRRCRRRRRSLRPSGRRTSS